jgi:hypothetical protein
MPVVAGRLDRFPGGRVGVGDLLVGDGGVHCLGGLVVDLRVLHDVRLVVAQSHHAHGFVPAVVRMDGWID